MENGVEVVVVTTDHAGPETANLQRRLKYYTNEHSRILRVMGVQTLRVPEPLLPPGQTIVWRERRLIFSAC